MHGQREKSEAPPRRGDRSRGGLQLVSISAKTCTTQSRAIAGDDIAGRSVIIEVQFEMPRRQLLHDGIDTQIDWRIVSTVASYKLLNDCPEGRRRQKGIGTCTATVYRESRAYY